MKPPSLLPVTSRLVVVLPSKMLSELASALWRSDVVKVTTGSTVVSNDMLVVGLLFDVASITKSEEVMPRISTMSSA